MPSDTVSTSGARGNVGLGPTADAVCDGEEVEGDERDGEHGEGEDKAAA